MPRGGARVNSGPAPDLNALRRDRADDKAGWITLPAAGRKGRTPRWPLLADPSNEVALLMLKGELEDLQLEAEVGEFSDKARKAHDKKIEQVQKAVTTVELKIEYESKLEKTVWRELWKTPQATQWEKLSWVRDVAVYARHRVRAELGSLNDAKEARQWSNLLGLNPAAMRSLRWKIGAPTNTGRQTAPTEPKQKAPSARTRFTVHDGGRTD